MRTSDLRVPLPAWFRDYLAADLGLSPSVGERARLAVELARLNVEHETGGPFGAVVFDAESGRVLGAGVNLVTSANCSVAHAEIVAIMAAQRQLGTYDLGAPGMPICELVCSCEPCAMCLGAIPWSGVRRLVCCAPSEAAASIGFDEGDRPVDWVAGLESRGVAVVRGIAGAEAAAVLQLYVERGGTIYNSQKPSGAAARRPARRTG